MDPKDVIRSALQLNHRILKRYLSDLSDSDLLVCPVPGASPIAWQLGHLVCSECKNVVANIPGGRAPELPAGFAEVHDRARCNREATYGYTSKAEYLAHFHSVRAATLTALDELPEASLKLPTPGDVMPRIAPTLADLFIWAATHEMMHAGQFAVIRHKLGKPVLI